MRVLVTGATGIVGSNLVRALLGASHKVRVLVRPESDLRGIEGLRVEHCEGDVLDPATVASAANGCTVVFHAAAVFSYWSAGTQDQKDLAIRGTRNILEAASKARARRVVITSSSVVLGSTPSASLRDEASEFDDEDPSTYTLSKVLQEKVAFELGVRLGIDVVAVCPTLTVGPYDYRLSPSSANLVNYLNDPFRSSFLGGCNIVSARDVATGHVLAAARGATGARYVLGSENLSWEQVHTLISELTGTFGPSITLNHTATYLAAAAAEVAARLNGSRPTVTRDEAKMSARYYWYSHERMARLGYAPMPARFAIADALAWLLGRSYVTDSVFDQLTLGPEVLDAQARLKKELKKEGKSLR